MIIRRYEMKNALSILLGLMLGFTLIMYLRVMHIEALVVKIAEKMEVAK